MDDLISRQAAIDEIHEYWRSLTLRRKRIPLAAEAVYMDLKGVVATLPSAQQWISCDMPPIDDRNVFIAVGHDGFMSCCIGHFDCDAKLWYEDRNWFAKIIYDAVFWCDMPMLPKGETDG